MREELKAFIDNEISDTDRTRILKEIEDNPDLQAEVIELRQMSRVIKEEAWQPQAVGLERTLGALAANKPTFKPWWMRNGLALIAAGACTVLFAFIMFPVFAQSKAASKKAPDMNGAQQDMAKSASPAMDMPALAEEGFGGAQAPADSQADSLAGKSSAGESLSFQRGTDSGLASRAPAAAPTAAFAQPRYQIKTANLSVEVVDVPKAQQDAENIAKAVNGRVESSQKSDDEGTLASAELTFRVPVANFETAVNRIRKLGRVLNDGLTGQDVTGQVVDAEARMKVMKAEEDQYVELLKATKKIGEVLSVKERLSQVRQEIESLEATRKVLKDQSAESTIHLSLTEKPSPDKPEQNPEWSEDAWSKAVNGLNAVGRALGSAAVFLFVFSPIWLPIALLAWWLTRRARR
ncbi:MAG: DUF4349 domain-containing protein [Chlorobia bacterium]|nr:DUF4349 domain-containing protein [Fimbriimonadaceae bacterium]